MARDGSVSLSAKFSKLSQQGAALILMAFILGLGTAVYLIKTFDTASLRAKQDAKTYKALKEAKVALIAWSVNHPNAPGLMPYPDRNEDGNYDNTSDCYASNVSFNTKFTLGHLPLFKSDPNCVTHDTIDLSGVHDVTVSSGLAEDFRDGAGERLWYEVSSNLLHDYKSTGAHSNGTSPIINPNIVNNPNPSYPWFVVRDRNGVVISDRVAAVIISPGGPVGTQDRSGGIADANQYLDKIVMADGTPYKNYGYQVPAVTPIQEFIIGDDLSVVSKTDPTYKDPSIESYAYNDKLVYITIDELMAALSKRAAAEAKAQLVNYKKATAITPSAGYYPYASAVDSSEYYQKSAQYTGFLPTQQPMQTSSKSCSVAYANVNSSSATCNFSSITNVEFTRTSGTFTGVTGTECSRMNSNKTCSCAITSGSSRCNGSAGRRFTCTTSGCSTTGTLPGNYVFKGVFSFTTSPSNVKANNSSGACSGCGANIATCAYTAATPSGSFSYDVTTTPAAFNSAITNSVLPAWFIANSWQDYLFYAVSSNCTYGQPCNAPDISVGSKASIQAMIAATGAPIVSVPFSVKGSAQSHSGCDVKEYLDSTENTNLDVKFEANNKLKVNNYNDQTFVVAP